ncbi:AAA family ATPase, partial [Marinilabilia sp.]|uniref:AAA family ATPase n=1 Tax=Marinilabilia sp. TaxID=2021252 RepID=UPI0025BA64B4
NKDFIQYIVNLKADRSFARDDDEHNIVKEIDIWFENFENNLKKIIGNDNLKLKFDRKTYNFHILENNKKPYGFNTLSDGYSAIISIVTELLLRMEAHNAKNYNLEGIVLIDEIETHLHVDLQKQVLPFLTNFFPRIQFIVTTHSPFILSSIQDAVICDLESKLVTDDLSAYSYDSLIESYFLSDKYSNEVKAKLDKFEKLMESKNLSDLEKEELFFLKDYFSQIPKYSSKELIVRLQQIELKSLNKKEE